ncbi:MAG: glycosyltransferase family 25 protein [Planctomycetia bacterium]|nr:glycosyltransferase family 25 protein [Planctomycetia bacterium]
MKCYVVNLDRRIERFHGFIQHNPDIGLEVIRFPGVDGSQFTEVPPEVDQRKIRIQLGKDPGRMGGVFGCYLSHIRALKTFLATGDDFAVLAQDDAVFPPHSDRWLQDVTETWDDEWDLLFLFRGHERGLYLPYRKCGTRQLAISLWKNSGAVACVVSRDGARRIVEGLKTITMAYDASLDHEWLFGFRTATLIPYPVKLRPIGESDTIPWARRSRLSALRRYWTVWPVRWYRTFCRLIYRYRRWRSLKKRHRSDGPTGESGLRSDIGISGGDRS